MFELIENKLVEERETPDRRVLRHLGAGPQHAVLFREGAVRLAASSAIDAYCEANRDDLRLETELSADYVRIDEGEYKVMLRVLENQIPCLNST